MPTDRTAASLREANIGRKAVLDRHVRRHVAAAKMGKGRPPTGPLGPLTPAEERYIHIETQKQLAKQVSVPPGLSALSPRDKRAYQRAHLHGGPSVTPITPGEQARVRAHPGSYGAAFKAAHPSLVGEIERNNAEYDAMLNPLSGENLNAARQIAWGLTGIPTLEHPGRSGPVDTGLAILGLFPFGKVAKLGDLAKTVGSAKAAEEVVATGRVGRVLAGRRARKALVRGPKRTEEQALQHVLETAKRHRQEGFGNPFPKIPEVKPGELSAETGGAAGQIVRGGLKAPLGKLRNEQEAARSVERSKRAGAIEHAATGKDGLERHKAAKAALEGALPKGEFNGFADLTPKLRDEAINHIYEHPALRPYEKVNTADALDQALAGKVPTKSEQKLLERAFGKEGPAVGLFKAARQNGWKRTLLDIVGVPKSLRASGDISAPFRQGLVVAFYKPHLFYEQLAPMMKSLVSESRFQGEMGYIHKMETFPTMEKSGLALTDIGESAAKGAAKLADREEAYISNVAEQIPVLGRVVRSSDRAYVGFLNLTRAHLFDTLVHQAASEGYHLTDDALRDIAKFVNSATGRGDIGALASHTATMNALFFSPRLLMSRLNFLNPVWYARLSPFARKEAIKAGGRLGGTLSLILYAAHLAGADVSLDPRNADFGKIRIGDTRIDIGAGFQQPLRLAAQLATGQIVSSTTGKVENLSGGFTGASRKDVLQQFLENKLAPVPAAIKNELSGQQFGQNVDNSLNPLDTNSQIANLYQPLSWQDALATGQETHSAKVGVGAGLLSSVGVGVQSYSAPKANSPDKIKAAETKALAELQQQESVLNVPAKWRRVYAKGVRVKVQRDLAKAQARKVSPSGSITDAEAYKITMRTLMKNRMMTPAQYKAAVGAIPGMSDRELRHWEYEAWSQLGPGRLLEQLHHYYNVKTGE